MSRARSKKVLLELKGREKAHSETGDLVQETVVIDQMVKHGGHIEILERSQRRKD